MKMIRRLVSKIWPRRSSCVCGLSRQPFEGLEERTMLHGSPLLWANEGRISISFAPDGTDIAGQQSKLFETFGAIESPVGWQTAVLRAFQTWSAHVSVDFGIVSDTGVPFGVSGQRVDDGRFGDIRIGAIELASDVAAVAISDSAALSGTWTGDIVFNTQANYQTAENIYAVALHEVGHLLGLSHSDSPLSVMHEHGSFTPMELSPEDIESAIHTNGNRLPDQYESPVANDTLGEATALAPVERGFGAGSAPMMVFADLHEPSDVDTFQIENRIRTRPEHGRPIDYRGPMTIQLQTSEISLLSPSLTLIDKNGRELGLARSSTIGGATLTLHVDSVDPQEEYYIQVAASGSDDAFSIGSYSLVVSYDDLLEVAINDYTDLTTHRDRDLPQERIHHLITRQDDDLSHDQNDSFASADRLVSRREFDFETYFREYGTISEDSSSDFYRFTTSIFHDRAAVLTTFVRSLEEGRLIPRVNIYDVRQNLVASRILANGAGELILQAELQANSNYFVEVTYADALFPEGDYSINLSFEHEPVQLQNFVTAEIEIGSSLQSQIFVGETQLFHFALGMENAGDEDDFVTLQIIDEAGNTVHRLSGRSGELRSSSAVLLKPGVYRSVFNSFGNSDSATIRLLGLAISDPFVVEPEDVIDEPEFACPDSDEVFCYPGGIRSDSPYLWDDFVSSIDNPIDTIEQIPTIIGEWWEWYWQQQATNGPVLGGNDSYDVKSGETLSIDAEGGVLGNDFDPEGGTFIAVLSQQAEHGSVELNADGSFQYTADEGFTGIDQFRYVAYDFITNSDEIAVTFNVSGTNADFDLNGMVDDRDIDLLCAAMQSGDPTFDLDRDGQINRSDVDVLLADVLGTIRGDANLDGRFDSSDLILVFSAGLYDAESDSLVGWRAGDWNCDGVFDSSDLIDVFTDGNYLSAARAARTDVAFRILSDDDADVRNKM